MRNVMENLNCRHVLSQHIYLNNWKMMELFICVIGVLYSWNFNIYMM